MVPYIKGSYSKFAQKNSLMLGHFPSTEKSRVGFPLLQKKLEPCYTGIQLSWSERATDNRKVGGSNPPIPTSERDLVQRANSGPVV